MVQRLGCNNGVTGEVLAPLVQVADSEISISFAVLPEQTAADCRGNDEVPYTVVLPEPLGERKLVDAQCAPGAEGTGTSFCRLDGMRHEPG